MGSRRLTIAVAAAWFAASLAAADSAVPPDPEPAGEADEAKPAPPANGEEDAKPKPPIDSKMVENVVVSVSARSEARLDAPAAVDVISGEDLETLPGDQIVDHIRRVPGINVVQLGARDVNIASRASTGGINTSTMVVTDGRNLYQDFLGFVMWEFAPTDFSLVDRVEVVRGPASSIWGANASGGVVQMFTKSPRDTLGGRLRIDAGNYALRRLEARESFLAGPWALRLSAGYLESDAFPRPVVITNVWGETKDPDLGLVPDSVGTSGTQQPRFDLRADKDDADGGNWILEAGTATTSGWIATGLGPFRVDSASGFSYVSGRYQRGLVQSQANVNYFDGSAVNLVNALPFKFTSGAAQYMLRGSVPIAARGVVGWGFDAERSVYSLSIAPLGTKRTKLGVYGDVDVDLADKLSLVAGARIDGFPDTVGTLFSPRLALRFKPRPNQTVRLAAGKGYRSPSVVETDLLVPRIPVALLDWEELDQQLIEQGVIDPVQFPDGFFALLARGVCDTRPDNCGAAPGTTPTYVAVTAARGSRLLAAEETRSIELGWAAQFRSFDVALTVYRNWTDGGIDFPAKAFYGIGRDGLPGTADDVVLPSDPNGDGIEEAPPVDLCPYGIGQLVQFAALCDDPGRPEPKVPYNLALSILLNGQIPALFQYENRGTVRNDGVEFGVSWQGPQGLGAALNYTWQADPLSSGIRMTDRIDAARSERASNSDLNQDGVVADTADFVNIPSRHHLSLNVQMNRPRWSAAASWDYVAQTFWQDVLTSDFWGYVSAYSLVGVRGGWRWPGKGLELTGQITNLLDRPIQQHIYGDVIGRRASVALAYTWSHDTDRVGN